MELKRVRSGYQLSPFMQGAQCYFSDYPELNEQNRELMASFIQETYDWCDILDDAGPSGLITAEKSLGAHLSQLDELGMHCYAGNRNVSLRANIGEENMKVVLRQLVLVFRQEDQESIVATISRDSI